jgi:AcrR family transcriptional regulator
MQGIDATPVCRNGQVPRGIPQVSSGQCDLTIQSGSAAKVVSGILPGLKRSRVLNMTLQDGPSANELPAQIGAREANRQRRLQEILSASWSVFAAEGHAGFSMRKVAQAVGLRLNNVQHYFGDLDTLLLETIQAGLSNYTTRYREVAADTRRSPSERLDAVLEDVLRDASDPMVGGIFVEVWALARHDAGVAQLVKNTYAHYIETLALLAAEVRPDLTPSEARATGAVIASVTEGMLVIVTSGALNPAAINRLSASARTACGSLFGTAKSP